MVRPDGTAVDVTVERATGQAAVAPQIAVLAVKQPDLPDAVQALAAWPGVVALTVQNGIGAEELVVSRRGASGLVAGSLTASVELGPDGSVRWLRRGGIGLAAVSGDVGQVLDELRRGFASAGLPAVALPDSRAMKWSKLMANLTGNATSAILDMDPAAVYADGRLFSIERRQFREAVEVMRRLGLRPLALPGADVPLLLRGFALPARIGRPILAMAQGGARGGKMPSLRIAVRAGTVPTEAAWLNGAVAAAARDLGTTAPVNARLADLVDQAASDASRRAWFRRRPDRLLDELDAPATAAT
jgi:2-dehydropantoate 2-reductase